MSNILDPAWRWNWLYHIRAETGIQKIRLRPEQQYLKGPTPTGGSKETFTTEQKLRAIIEAQENGEHHRWSVWKDTLLMYGDPAPENVIACLLDPEGLKAAYGGTPYGMTAEEYRFTGLRDWPLDCGHRIFSSWYSGGAEAAIDTAYDLLPNA